jgi:GNAT superfamily N-acetyltransferase
MDPVRPATMADVDAVTDMVAEAFAADPAWCFMLGEGRVAPMRSFAHALLIPRVRRGTAWVTHDGTAVAMWDRLSIDLTREPEDDERWAAFRAEIGEEAWRRVTTYEVAVGSAKPDRPYWYLGVLATHPSMQRRGLASAVLQPGLAAAQADGWDCWLETSTPSNKAFYAGHGFTEARVVDVPGGPPTSWLRRRRASSGPA